MRAAVISDIHSDPEALNRVLAAIDQRDTDEIWCLGDIIGLGGHDPAAALTLVRKRCTVVLAGNHDRWVTGGLPLDMLALPRQRSELLWQRDQLTAEQLAWLTGLPVHARQHDIELWHASAQDPVTGWISSHVDAAEHLARQRASIGLVGHTHRPLIARLRYAGVDFDEAPHHEDLAGAPRAVLNPGAVTHNHCWLELDLDAQLANWHTA